MEISVPILLATLLLGIVAGVLPGLHPNSIGAILDNFFGQEEFWPILLLILLGCRMALQFLPSIFLGVPDAETQVAALPGQRMLLEGKAQEAVLICAFSVLLATFAAMLLSPLALIFLPAIFAFIKPWIGPLLILAMAAAIFSEEGMKHKARAFAVFLLAWALGQITLNLPLSDPLFPMFVGFFTMPFLLSPSSPSSHLPAQENVKKINPDILPFIALGIVFGALADLLPGISTPAQIALFASFLIPLSHPRHFLALVASIEASHSAFALTSSAAIGVARVGVVAMAQQAMQISSHNLPLLFGAFALAVGVGALAAIFIGKKMAKYWHEIDWSLLGKIIVIYLVLMVLLNCGILGIIVLVAASAIGALPILWNIRRTHVMGSLIGPSILYSLGL